MVVQQASLVASSCRIGEPNRRTASVTRSRADDVTVCRPTPGRASLQNQTGSRQEGLGPICQRTEDDGKASGDMVKGEVREFESHERVAVR